MVHTRGRLDLFHSLPSTRRVFANPRQTLPCDGCYVDRHAFSLQERLAAAGFVTVAFDRYGCGLSDDNRQRTSPTVDEALADMRAVYDRCFPAVSAASGARGRVILFGPSMGSIVGTYLCQCCLCRVNSNLRVLVVWCAVLCCAALR